MAARTGASVLTAAGVPELIAFDLAEYENLALALGRDAERRTALRKTIRENHEHAPLFDGQAFAQALEEALQAIAEDARGGNL